MIAIVTVGNYPKTYTLLCIQPKERKKKESVLFQFVLRIIMYCWKQSFKYQHSFTVHFSVRKTMFVTYT